MDEQPGFKESWSKLIVFFGLIALASLFLAVIVGFLIVGARYILESV